jgi:hypothetical protein
MNRLSLILVFLFLTLKANAIYVTNLFVFPDGNTNRNVSVSFESIGTPLVLSNGTTIVSYSFNCVATNGVLGPTFLVGGPNYKVIFGPNPSGTWTIGAPLGTNTYGLTTLASNINTLTIGGYVLGVQVAAGTNTTTQTNNGVVTINSSGGGGGSGLPSDGHTIVTNGSGQLSPLPKRHEWAASDSAPLLAEHDLRLGEWQRHQPRH